MHGWDYGRPYGIPAVVPAVGVGVTEELPVGAGWLLAMRRVRRLNRADQDAGGSQCVAGPR